MQIAVLMTCFNRKRLTLAGLESLFQQKGIEDHRFSVYLVDDGSTDGTAEAVSAAFPQVHVLAGDGNLFWNGGMRKAFAEALKEPYDAYLWFNDDTLLLPDAVARLLRCEVEVAPRLGPAIVVGSVCDPVTGKHTYGGFRRRASGLRLDFVAQPPDPTMPIACDTMNGNLTLIPAAVARRLGNLDGGFHHQLGDVDYGLRATREGISVVLAPGYVGTCAVNPLSGTWRDGSVPLRKRWAHLMSPKGAPPREWFLYTFRHFGWRAPLYALSPYLKALNGTGSMVPRT